jgi:Nif-specific regulatory protein
MRAQLTIEAAGGSSAYELEPDRPVTLGRSRENAIVLADEHASRVHARIEFTGGRWVLHDLDSRNGTLLDGGPVSGAIVLADGGEIVIGETHIRFAVGGEPITPVPKRDDPPDGTGESTTHLQADELTTLCRFMAVAVGDNEPSDLLRRALRTLLKQTDATLAGYLGLDADDPVAKLVLPDDARVDRHLSRQLTSQVQSAGRLVWLGAEQSARPNDSLMPFTDALCLPVTAAGESIAAVHVYKSNVRFTDRDVRFCEALVGFLANALSTLRARRKLEAENSRLRGYRVSADVLVGKSPAIKQLRGLIGRVAPQNATVLIVGESGTGKELVAAALHKQGRHGSGPLVAVNCAAIPPTMMEAELFGYRRGAFSGADRDYPGLFQQADEGTLFFDEVGELSADCQAKLLRVIETKCFKPLGTTAEVKADVRVIAATNRDLGAEVRTGRFRQDLYFRLKVVTVPVPALRDHADDIHELIQYFLTRLAQECHKSVTLTPAALKKLQGYSWPGNVRQLRSTLENAVVMADGDTVDAAAFHLAEGEAAGGGLPLNLDELERWAITEALKRTNGNKSHAADLVGISRETLANKLKKYGMN